MACSELEELVLIPRTDTEEINIGSVARIVAARTSRGVKLRTVMVVGGQDRVNLGDVLELRKRVLDVEYDPEVRIVDENGEDSDEKF